MCFDTPIYVNVPRFSLVIGIDNYESEIIPNLSAAVADANAVERYLLDKNVSPDHIINLRSPNDTTKSQRPATRDEIIRGFRELQKNDHIQKGDAILIFFAGHGGQVKAPEGFLAERGKVQFIYPQDSKEDGGCIVNVIQDRAMRVLLEDLANEKGNNITVVFDCCHSHSGTREGKTIRQFEMVAGQLPSDKDCDVLASRLPVAGSNTTVWPILLHHGLDSHVLLAACSSESSACESNGRGNFTKALIETLYEYDDKAALTYRNLVELLPDLDGQHPHCEGRHIDRILFSTEKIDDPTSILVKTIDNTYRLMAGEAHGITLGSRFDIREQPTASSAPLCTLGVSAIQATYAHLESPTTKPLPKVAYARLACYAFPDCHRLRVQFSGFEDVFVEETLDAANAGLATSEIDKRFSRVANEDTSQVLINRHGDCAVFQTRIRHGEGQEHELYRLTLDKPAHSAEAIARVLRLVGHWQWHFGRPVYRQFRDKVSVNFYQLTPTLSSDMNCNGCIDIKANPKDRFGMKIVNDSEFHLFVYLFYFGVNKGSIQNFGLGSGGKKVDAPLPSKSSLAIGYDGSGTPPLQFVLPEGESPGDLPGFFKLYLTTTQTSFDLIKDISPFKASRHPGKPTLERWDAVTVKITEHY